MATQSRSDDYIDGLQTAYKLVYKLNEKAVISDYKRAYQHVIMVLNDAIDDASVDRQRIITL